MLAIRVIIFLFILASLFSKTLSPLSLSLSLSLSHFNRCLSHLHHSLNLHASLNLIVIAANIPNSDPSAKSKKKHHALFLGHLFSNILLFPRNFSNSLTLFLSFAPKNLSFSLQLSQPLVEEPKREIERKVASFSEAPPGDPKVGEKIFKTKCA